MPANPNPVPLDDYGLPFARNYYFTGKLMLERDFHDEQRYYVDYRRLHNRRLHGYGVVCGLQVNPHTDPNCQTCCVLIEPGLAIDACGREILVRCEECLDLTELPAIKQLAAGSSSYVQIVVRYRECGTEPIPVLYDECGCDDARCLPNRILEAFEFDAIIGTPPTASEPSTTCPNDLYESTLTCPAGCPPEPIVLATLANYTPGDAIVAGPPPAPPAANTVYIDNQTDRPILVSTSALQEAVECLLTVGGPPGAQGEAGPPGVGLTPDLNGIDQISWVHDGPSAFADITLNAGEARGIVISFKQPVTIESTNVVTNVFEVSADQTPPDAPGFLNRMLVVGTVIPVEVTSPPRTRITAAKQVPVSKDLSAIAFCLPKAMKVASKTNFFIRLRGDFVHDAGNPATAISASFLIANFNNPAAPIVGMPGGVFESWFTFA